MDDHAERRRYYSDESAPRNEAMLEAVQAHESASLSADEFRLYDRVNPEALDSLFTDTAGVDIRVQITLTNVTVGVWSDGGIDIHVSDKRG